MSTVTRFHVRGLCFLSFLLTNGAKWSPKWHPKYEKCCKKKKLEMKSKDAKNELKSDSCSSFFEIFEAVCETQKP